MEWRSSTLRWKAALAAFAIAVAMLDAWALSRIAIVFSPEAHGSLGAQFDPLQAGWLRVRSMADRSPLAAAGVKPGDEVLFGRRGDALRYLEAGEPIELVVRDAAGTRPLRVTALPETPSAHNAAELALMIPGSLLMLVVGTLVGWRGADAIALRALSASLLSQTLHVATQLLPGGALQDLLSGPVAALTGTVAYVCFMYFAMSYAQWPLLGERRGRVAYRLYLVSFLAYDAFSMARRASPELASAIPSLHGIGYAEDLFSAAFSLLVLVIAWRRANGQRRERLGWIVACLGAIDVAYFGEILARVVGGDALVFAADIVAGVLVAAGNVGLAYAVLRYRILDFGFAVNRAMVYGTTSLVLAGIFMLASQLLNRVLQFEAREDHRILDIAIGLGLALTARQAVRWVDPRVQRIFFRRWHAASAKLAAFRIEAIHGKDPALLRADFLDAIREFSGARSVALYGPEAGGLRRQETLGDGMPARIAPESPVARALEAASSAVDIARIDPGFGDAALALPLKAHGRLLGAVLVGPRAEDDPFRPDERKQLAQTAQQVAIELELARLRALETRVAAAPPAPSRDRKRRKARSR